MTVKIFLVYIHVHVSTSVNIFIKVNGFVIMNIWEGIYASVLNLVVQSKLTLQRKFGRIELI